MSHLLQPTVVLLKDGSEQAQGKSHVIHNINACQTVSEIVRTTLGPRGMDKLIYNQNGGVTISNDGRTIIDLLDIVHPAAKTLVDIAVAQDNEVGDGTTSVVVLASEFLKMAKQFIEDGVHPQTIIRAYRQAQQLVLAKIDELAINYKTSAEKTTLREVLERCARTALQSKLISNNRDLFGKMAVDAVTQLDEKELDLNLIGIEKVAGGSVTASELVLGVAFKKTFSYAGFEQQPKAFIQPLIVCLNVELELKAEKANAEIRLKDPSKYQSIIDAEWSIIYKKLDLIVQSGAKVILSRLAIGDLATQYFADRNLFCAGRVPEDALKRVCNATGAVIQTSLGDLSREVLGECGKFEEKQIGNDRYNFFTECKQLKTATIILRGGAEQFIEETHRSLWDALMIVKRCIQHNDVVGGAGAIEMELSRYLRQYSLNITDKTQLILSAYAKALEVIPRQLSHNAGLDSTDVINKLRYEHASNNGVWCGVDIEDVQPSGVVDAIKSFIWEPSLNKKSAIAAATEATCTILSIDETIKNAKAQDAANNAKAPIPGAMPQGMPSIN
eukprot:206889_1